MKKTLRHSLLIALFALFGMGAVCSCAPQEGSQEEKATAPASKNKDSKDLPNYRYVDIDSVLSKYNLSKDYSEEMLRMQNNLESTMRQKQSSLESMAQKYQQKYQNNGYSSQEEFERDQRSLANAQNSAQKETYNLQTNYEKQAMQMQKTVNDSIESFIKAYNAKHGYDAIFMKAATIYIDPRLDITDEVVEGLNKRYNKK